MKNTMKVAIFLLTCLAVFGCLLFIPTYPQCDFENILLEDNMMPPVWERLWRVSPPSLPKLGAQDALSIVYEYRSNISHHSIYQYRNRAFATLFLSIFNQDFFPSSGDPSRSWIWSEVEGSSDWGLHGNINKIRCGDSNDPFLGSRCSAVIQYGAYISKFSSPMEEGIMSEEEFKKIVVGIDEKFLFCQK